MSDYAQLKARIDELSTSHNKLKHNVWALMQMFEKILDKMSNDMKRKEDNRKKLSELLLQTDEILKQQQPWCRSRAQVVNSGGFLSFSPRVKLSSGLACNG